ncbi:NADH-quinone oxidoreductase subunit M [Mangrovactinospora gilvigrisea]|uniref:NADH-quinone oxidoreductase subunit M n=1 Tax=Mangrovactinospora gilvigrisea TaxID=1428644 RepID=A0A1J7BK40_9ACTN|nr:NADH-quinone oxidoreductase subunit M [Mangrovactinospora gilvigrisea]OIV39047.1 NADH-quinone oxidoreductase subunit M [Mangrovactinospora gilvigrisea]
MSFPLLTVTAAVPAAGAVITGALPAARRGAAKATAMGFALATLVLAAVVTGRFRPGGAQYQLTESHSWIPAFGVRYQLGVDGIAVVLVLLTAVLLPVVMLASWHDADLPAEGPKDKRRPAGAFFGLMLAIEAMVIIAFEATDVFLFYIFFEAMLIPMYFLIGGFGQKYEGRRAAVGDSADESSVRRSRAAVKFLLYNLLGGLVMLAAVVALYVNAHSFSVPALQNAHLSTTAERLIFLGFMFAFAVKAPLWPLHTWLPGAMGESTAGTAVLITAVVDKVGTFAMLRFCLQLFPGASAWATPVVLVLAVISILYGAILAVVQKDIKRLIAYASISHFGFIILGIFALNSRGQSGATLYMVNHGISTAALMLIAGFLISRRGSALIADFGGVQKVAPILAGTFLVAGLATLSLPGLAPFTSEFLVLLGAFEHTPAIGVAAVVGIVFAALYVLVLYQRTMTGPVKDGVTALKDLKVREIAVVAPLMALLLFLGVYPQPVLNVVNPSVGHTMSALHKQDPKPTHPVAEAINGGSR